MVNAPTLFLPFGTYLNYSFFWLTCTTARPPQSTFKFFPVANYVQESRPLPSTPNDLQPFRSRRRSVHGSLLLALESFGTRLGSREISRAALARVERSKGGGI